MHGTPPHTNNCMGMPGSIPDIHATYAVADACMAMHGMRCALCGRYQAVPYTVVRSVLVLMSYTADTAGPRRRGFAHGVGCLLILYPVDRRKDLSAVRTICPRTVRLLTATSRQRQIPVRYYAGVRQCGCSWVRRRCPDRRR